MDTQLMTTAPVRPVLELDLIADLACPWSYLGKRSLERALTNLYGAPVKALRWHGFRLHGEAGSDRVPWRDHLATRLPAGMGIDFAHRNLADAGRQVGIAFDFDRLQYLPDTREAHRLVRLASREGRQSEIVDALFSAFFEQGRNIGDREVLEDIARSSTLTPEVIAAFLDPEQGRDEVVAEETRLRSLGIVTTPSLVINGRVLVPGPADVPTYVQALDQALFPELPAPQDKRKLH